MQLNNTRIKNLINIKSSEKAFVKKLFFVSITNEFSKFIKKVNESNGFDLSRYRLMKFSISKTQDILNNILSMDTIYIDKRLRNLFKKGNIFYDLISEDVDDLYIDLEGIRESVFQLNPFDFSKNFNLFFIISTYSFMFYFFKKHNVMDYKKAFSYAICQLYTSFGDFDLFSKYLADKNENYSESIKLINYITFDFLKYLYFDSKDKVDKDLIIDRLLRFA